MALRDAIDELRGLDASDLELDNLGSWPVALKAIICAVALAACVLGGHQLFIKDLQLAKAAEERREQELRHEFERKAFKVANLDALRKQMAEIEQSFGALLSQLPRETEVPGLLEDITEKGVSNGLEMRNIKLLPEQSKDFYVELPINIAVTGTYHDLAGFVSGIAGLPRIVTLHDYNIKKVSGENLTMSIRAKTYRYKEDG